MNEDSDIQPEDDYMKKENALKYKAGRKYNNSEKDNGKALT